MLDLKFMAEGIDLYDIDAATSEDTGYEKENLQDRKRATSWKATSTVLQNIDIDMNANTGVNYFFFYHNISHNSETATIKIYSDDNASFISPTQRGSTLTLTDHLTPHALIELGATITERYWRITIENSDVAPEVYLIFFGADAGALLGITVRYMMGQGEEKIYDGSVIVETPSGVRASRQYHGGRGRYEYAWDHLDALNEARLQNLIALSKGKALPFFLQLIQEVTPKIYKYVRLMNLRVGSKQVGHELFNTDRLIFEEEF